MRRPPPSARPNRALGAGASTAMVDPASISSSEGAAARPPERGVGSSRRGSTELGVVEERASGRGGPVGSGAVGGEAREGEEKIFAPGKNGGPHVLG